MRFSRVNFILAVSLLVMLTVLAGGLFAYHTSCRGRILYGVQSEGHSLFGMTQTEAEQYFTQLGKRRLAAQRRPTMPGVKDRSYSKQRRRSRMLFMDAAFLFWQVMMNRSCRQNWKR